MPHSHRNSTPPDVDPHAALPISPFALVQGIVRHRKLIVQMSRREVLGRYKGSLLGVAWSFFNPLLMLSVYTFVFSAVFKARWGSADENKLQFAVVLFVGMIALNFFSEVLNRAPGIITGNANFVKKVVFPLEVLPVVAVFSGIFHALVSVAVLLPAQYLLTGTFHWTLVFAPLVFLPLVMLVTGVGWLLASLGVFLRDAGQTIALVTTMMMFLSPVFYPMTAIPVEFRAFMAINPLAFVIEQARAVMVWGQMPDWAGLGLHTAVSVCVLWGGYAWFQKTRKGFADVL